MLKRLVVFLVLSFLVQPTLAKRARRILADTIQKQEVEKSKGTDGAKSSSTTWEKGKQSFVQIKGQGMDESANCKLFNVKIEKKLHMTIDCIGHEMTRELVLETSADQSVTQKSDHITITRYNYLVKKPQVSRLNQSTLKVPFVEEIIHLKKNPDGELSFYYESFKEDEFGRIVQDSFIQAHSLAKQALKISSNK